MTLGVNDPASYQIRSFEFMSYSGLKITRSPRTRNT